MKVYLSNRLLLVARMIPKGHVAADIGTDHAYLPIYLVKEHICPKVIATDVARGPYEKALENIKIAGVEGAVELRCGSGLEPLSPGEVQTAVMAGMGGETIAGILRDSMTVASSMEQMLLQPMRNLPKLRKWLFLMGFKIIDEDVALEDSRFYEIIAVKRQKTHPFDAIDIAVGPIIREKRTPRILKYIGAKISRLESLIKSLEDINTISAGKALEEYKRELQMWEEILK